MKKILIVAFVSLVVCGCVSTYGEPITQAKIDKIAVGQTTIGEALGIFGKPLAETTNSDGSTVLSWGHAQAGMASGGASQGLSIIFDKTGKATSFSKSEYKGF